MWFIYYKYKLLLLEQPQANPVPPVHHDQPIWNQPQMDGQMGINPQYDGQMGINPMPQTDGNVGFAPPIHHDGQVGINPMPQYDQGGNVGFAPPVHHEGEAGINSMHQYDEGNVGFSPANN